MRQNQPIRLLFREETTPTSDYIPHLGMKEGEVRDELNVVKSEVMTNVTQPERIVQSTTLTLKILNFSRDSDNISEVMECLGKLLPYTGNQIPPVIINFVQNSVLDLLLSLLSPYEISNFNEIRQAVINKYKQSDDGYDFYLITQASSE